MNVVTTLEAVERRGRGELALRFDDVELTHKDLLDLAARFAGFLASREVRAGDRIGIYLPNHPHWLPALFGIWKVGAVAVPLNYLFSADALHHAVEDSGCVFLLVTGEDTARVRSAFTDLEVGSRLIAMTPDEQAAASWDDVRTAEPLLSTVPRLDADEALIMYTSGSTGTPKGVRQTHRNTSAQCDAVIDVWKLTGADHVLVCTPLFHVGGLQLVSLPVLFAGGTVTLQGKWEPQVWLDDAMRLRPTVVALVPTMMVDVVHRAGGERFTLSSVRVCAVGGAALPESRLKAFTAATGVTPVNIYGQTEQSGLALTEPLDEEPHYGSLGKPLAQVVQCQVVRVGESTPIDAGSDEPGELWVRGDAVTPGYWNLPEVNAEKFVDGWFRTSDLVRRDADGYLYYVDRADDMIISGGENVYPQSVEGQLEACPLIGEVVVIGTPHERWGQQVTAVVVVANDGVSVEQITAWCEEQKGLRGLMRPRRIEIVKAIPRTATNKVDRSSLKATFR